MLGLDLRLGPNEENDPLRPHRDGGPDLLTVYDVLVPNALTLAFERSQVASRVGLGIARAPVVGPVENFGDEALFLLLGAVLDDRGPHPGNTHEAASRRAAPCSCAISSFRMTCSMMLPPPPPTSLGHEKPTQRFSRTFWNHSPMKSAPRSLAGGRFSRRKPCTWSRKASSRK